MVRYVILVKFTGQVNRTLNINRTPGRKRMGKPVKLTGKFKQGFTVLICQNIYGN